MPLIHDCVIQRGYLAVILALICLSGVALAMRQQSVGARGRLSCGGVPASNIRVKLIDKDTGPDPDDELDATWVIFRKFPFFESPSEIRFRNFIFPFLAHGTKMISMSKLRDVSIVDKEPPIMATT